LSWCGLAWYRGDVYMQQPDCELTFEHYQSWDSGFWGLQKFK
jgi:hypothetical protein